MNSLNNLNIAVIKCSGGLNLRNEFINAGGTELIQKFFAASNRFNGDLLKLHKNLTKMTDSAYDF